MSDPVKRRLPVIQTKAPEDDAAERRPSWQWVVIGAGFVLTIWIPLVIAGLWLARAVAVGDVFAVLATFALACIAAGALVGRFGGRATEREALLAGVTGAVVAGIITLVAGQAPLLMAALAALALSALGAVFAWLGGRIGVRTRGKGL